MQGQEKHEFPRFVSLPLTILLWVLLVSFIAATLLVWSEQVPTYAVAQGIIVLQPATQPEPPTIHPAVQPTIQPTVQQQSVVQPVIPPTQPPVTPPLKRSASLSPQQIARVSKPVWPIRRSTSSLTSRPTSVPDEAPSPTARSMNMMERSFPSAGRPMAAIEQLAAVAESAMSSMSKPVSRVQKPKLSTPATVVLFFSPAQAQNLYVGMGIGLNISASGKHMSSQITKILPGVMQPAALRSLFHLDNPALAITQPSIAVMAKLDDAVAATYVGSLVTATLQIGSQRLISFLPGVGRWFAN